MNKFPALMLSAALLVAASASHAQSYSWASRSGGTATGATAAGAANNWTWAWNPGGQAITGTASMTRTGAGATYSTSETMDKTIAAAGFGTYAFDNSTFSNTVGGVNGISQFVSEGELSRAANDVAQGNSTSTMNFAFDAGKSSPLHTQVMLFDPGAFEGGVNGPFTYTFSASLGGVAVNTSSWTLRIEDPYSPSNNHTSYSNFSWNGSTLTLSSFLDGRTSGMNFPDTLVFLDTQNTSFDKLVVTAVGPNVDTFAIGFGANTAALAAPVPEPATALLAAMGLLAVMRQVRRTRA